MNNSTRQTMLTSSSSSSSYGSIKLASLNDLMQHFCTLIENVRINHQNDIDILNQRICELETENRQLHEYQQQQIYQQHQQHSVFDINYISNDTPDVERMKAQLSEANDKINSLQLKVDQQYSEIEDMVTKKALKSIFNENNKNATSNSNVDSAKLVELESKFKQIKDQLNQFEQSHFESDEQIRLLKQLVSTNDSEQIDTITQSLTVKQADLHQQTDIVTNILHKQQEKILEKIANLFEQTSQINQPKSTTTTTNKKAKKKRL